MESQGYRFLDHTADIAVEAWAPSQEALLIEAARALIDVVTEGARIPETSDTSVEVDAADPEDRLVQWLNEVLWLAVGRGFLLSNAEITLRDGGLTARVQGQADAPERMENEVKSATYHGLRLARTDAGGYVARVVLDV